MNEPLGVRGVALKRMRVVEIVLAAVALLALVPLLVVSDWGVNI
jgi:hypothetical protein